MNLIAHSALGKAPGLDGLATVGNIDAWADFTALVELQTPAFNIVTLARNLRSYHAYEH